MVPPSLPPPRQIQAKIQVIRQRLQSDPQFRGAYTKQVAKEMQLEQTLEGKLTQAGRTREAKVREEGGGRRDGGGRACVWGCDV